jgi:hypothetical protein
MTGETKVVDFHNHHIPARFELTATRTQRATQRARWEMLARKLPDEDLLLRDVGEGHLAARVVNIPGNLIADADGHVPHETIMAMNDANLSYAQHNAIAAGNCLRLLKVAETSARSNVHALAGGIP